MRSSSTPRSHRPMTARAPPSPSPAARGWRSSPTCRPRAAAVAAGRGSRRRARTSSVSVAWRPQRRAAPGRPARGCRRARRARRLRRAGPRRGARDPLAERRGRSRRPQGGRAAGRDRARGRGAGRGGGRDRASTSTGRQAEMPAEIARRRHLAAGAARCAARPGRAARTGADRPRRGGPRARAWREPRPAPARGLVARRARAWRSTPAPRRSAAGWPGFADDGSLFLDADAGRVALSVGEVARVHAAPPAGVPE